ncbi:glycosyltransferase [Oleiagrimonas sp. MCCC 1A03011]|uniref:glycosyltransferase n=1 Tax=Oleiagrimonas sp. MCCC 1A03011 TaxID=1926883 RepID=UPI000DC4EEB2|nr:glycosyltransferase [Oleiagrimonas sp. MCCC 1A03011]RAP56872.1 hypothetical protein BTJ49_12010 [Oleiagrimonas sp. MCCC 1A03011]
MEINVPSINLVARDNGVGLSRDLGVLGETLRAGGFDVTVTGIRGGKLTKWLRPPAKRIEWRYRRVRGKHVAPRFDVNIMLEHIWPDDLPFARHNVLMPNPEWFLPRDRRYLGDIDLVLAKTRHAERIFRRLNKPVMYTGFTGRCRFDPEQPRKATFFHLAGRSHAKGTERLLALWRRHPEWPLLTVVQNPRTARPGPPAANIHHHVGYIDDAELRRLQNTHRFHLCPSETEGFGHYIAEAMTVGALTVTVDAAPMNELITPERGLLVPCERTGTQHLATTHFFDEAAMEQAIETAIRIDKNRLEQMGQAARTWHRENRENFGLRLINALHRLLDEPEVLSVPPYAIPTPAPSLQASISCRTAQSSTLRKTVA